MDEYFSKEHYLTTPRTYWQSLEELDFSEDFLAGKMILEVGGGLSNFTQTANKRLKNKGTKVISIDLNYDILGLANKEYIKELHRRESTIQQIDTNYSRKAFKRFLKTRRAAILQSAKRKSVFIAGDREQLPLKSNRFDLVQFNNSLYPACDHSQLNDEVVWSFLEALRVLNPHGQIRCALTPFDIDTHDNLFIRQRDFNPETKNHANTDLAKRFHAFEDMGHHFYTIEDYDEEREEWTAFIMVLTKEPHTFTANEVMPKTKRVRVRELFFSKSKDNHQIPTKIVFHAEKKRKNQ